MGHDGFVIWVHCFLVCFFLNKSSSLTNEEQKVDLLVVNFVTRCLTPWLSWSRSSWTWCCWRDWQSSRCRTPSLSSRSSSPGASSGSSTVSQLLGVTTLPYCVTRTSLFKHALWILHTKFGEDHTHCWKRNCDWTIFCKYNVFSSTMETPIAQNRHHFLRMTFWEACEVYTGISL